MDIYGAKRLPVWAALIDTRDYSVPHATLAEAERTKSGNGYWDVPARRAVGGANLQHDVETLHAFRVLSTITGDPRYARAADDYVTAFLINAQSPDTGLLAWGEHLYYDVHRDAITVCCEEKERDWTHEFLPKTPIWRDLWQVSPERTTRALEGLRYHFDGPTPTSFLFNRHASAHKVVKVRPGTGRGLEQYESHREPFIGHAGQFAYSFMFLHTKTGKPEWLKWSQGVGNVHWEHRNPATNLTPWVLAQPEQEPRLVGTAHLAYFLYKTYELDPELQSQLRERALILFDAAERSAWRPDGEFYVDDLNMDGTPVTADDPRFSRERLAAGDQVRSLATRPRLMPVVGRAAAYFYAREKTPHHLLVASRIAALEARVPLPETFFATQVANRIHLLMDVYELTADRALLERAARLADRGVAGLWRGGLFARRTGDPFYESKDGIGDFVRALLRVHLAQAPPRKGAKPIDWSF